MKKIISILLAIIMFASFSISAFAVGDGNIDGGGGSMGDGDGSSYWSFGNEGVRITVVRASDNAAVTIPIDLLNRPPTNNNIYHFGKVSKLSYSSGTNLTPKQGKYISYLPQQSIPTIISTNGINNIEAIKSYFTDELIIRHIAQLVGMDFDILIGGEYKLLIEPLAYFKFMGVDILATATEASLYDKIVNGTLRKTMGNLTHRNLPLAMFLETSDLGYPAWSGSKTDYVSNANIASSLGLGIVKFTDEKEQPVLSNYDYEYRTDTEVITSIYVSGGERNPDNPANVTFNIEGVNYNVGNIYYPEDDSQIVWVKWTTPSEPQEMVINVSSSNTTVSQTTINVNIVDLDENPPPNPVADDRNDSFELSNIPSREEKTKLEWSVWSCYWKSNWEWESNWVEENTTVNIPALWRNPNAPSQTSAVYVLGWTYEPSKTEITKTLVDKGKWVDNGWWEFKSNEYYAELTSSMNIYNDSNNPTGYSNVLKSGYGFNQTVSSSVNSNQSNSVTKTPNAVTYFPEFNYETYWRLLERNTNGDFSFKVNNYSTYMNRTHFTPIWFPDGEYVVNTHIIDYWTPAGMLSLNLSDSLRIQGDLWMDWHIGPKDNE